MTAVHHNQPGRCSAKRTVLLVGEGPMERAFLRHVVDMFVARNGPVAARTENANGGAPETVIKTARKLMRQRAYDVCVILMDRDVQWPASRPARIMGTRMCYLASVPCFEGLLLRIAGHTGITRSSTVDECKRALYAEYVDERHRVESRAYCSSFPKDLLVKRRTVCAELHGLLKELGVH